MKYIDYFADVPTLYTSSLTIRAFTHEDMEAYLAILQDPAVTKYTGNAFDGFFKDEQAVRNWLNNINGRLLKAKKVFTWCIEHREHREVIGRIDLGGFEMRTVGDIAYHIASAYWNKGLMTEAIAAVTDFGLNELYLHRIQAFVLPQNKASVRVLEKNGYEQEGVLRKYHFGKEFHDTAVLSVVREENIGVKK